MSSPDSAQAGLGDWPLNVPFSFTDGGGTHLGALLAALLFLGSKCVAQVGS